MKKFFVIAGLIVLILVFGPVLFLASRAKHELGRYAGKTVLYNSFPAKLKTIDPCVANDVYGAALLEDVYEGLYAYHYLKRPVEVIPLLAEGMPDVSADGKTYTVKIRQDVEYAPNPCFGVDAQGQPQTRFVRAQDFVLTFLRIADSHLLSPGWPSLSERIVGLDEYYEKTKKYERGDFSRYNLSVEGVQALDDHTLQLKLMMPYPAMIYNLMGFNSGPTPPEVIQYYLERRPAYREIAPGRFEKDPGGGVERPMNKRTPEITEPAMSVGTGPYKITIWERGTRIVQERNLRFREDLYPSEGGPGDLEAGLLADAGKPMPFIDVLYYQFITEDYSLWMQFLAGQLDISRIPSDVFNMVVGPDKKLGERWERRGIRLVQYENPTVYLLGFNMGDPVIKASPSLRKAMCLSYDVESYVDLIFNGRGIRAVNRLPSSLPEHQEAGPGPYYRYDVKAAREMLEQAKKELAAAGLLQRDGTLPTIVLDIPGLDEFRRRVGEFSKQQFETIGIPIKVQLNDWPTFQQKINMRQTQVYWVGYSSNAPDAEEALQTFYGPNIEKGVNKTNYRNSQFDELYRQIIVMPDSPQRRSICAKMVQMLSNDVPVLMISEPIWFVAIRDYVGNYKYPPFGHGMTKHLRIDRERQRQTRGG
ncbi:MAG: ABC transporter substrate-binding protein [Phycisphaerae bacterium]|nr:ABC transporter substrate-binding protein [Phycisphaerae bacterium]